MTDARGKLGGQVFSKNRAGSYVRTKVTPVNPQTSFQQASRFLLGSLSQQWSGLTRTQVQAWNDAVSDWARTDIFGDLRNPTGKNLYTEVNKNRIQAGYALTTTPPRKMEMPVVVLNSIDVDSTSGDVGVNITGNAVGFKLQIRATPEVSNGTTFVKDKLRVIGYVAGSVAGSVDVTSLYNARFSQISNGDANLFFELRVVLPTGQMSASQIVRADVTS